MRILYYISEIIIKKGTYNRVSKKHLQKYINEFVYRFNLKGQSDMGKFSKLLSNANVRTKYDQLVKV